MKKHLLAAAFLLASLSSSHALLLSFDSSPITSGSGAPLSASFTIDFAVLIEEDILGDPLANPYWSIDPSAPAVTAGSPADAGYGLSTDPALDVTAQPVLFTFSTPVSLDSFTAVLDDSTLGNLGAEQIQFFDAADVLLASITVNQSTPGFVAATAAPLTGVSKILLPTSAFYDNINLVPTPVPEPGLTALGAVAAVGLGLRRRR